MLLLSDAVFRGVVLVFGVVNLECHPRKSLSVAVSSHVLCPIIGTEYWISEAKYLSDKEDFFFNLLFPRVTPHSHRE